MTSDELLAEAVGLIRAAINAGDWAIDGASDPDWFLSAAEEHLLKAGYTINSIDGHLQRCA